MKRTHCKTQSQQAHAHTSQQHPLTQSASHTQSIHQTTLTRFFTYTLSALLCFLLAACTSLGPIFRNQDPQLHLGTLADCSWINALIFIAAFAIYAIILWTIIYYGKHASFPKQYSRLGAWIKSIFRKKHKTNAEKTDKKTVEKTVESKSESTPNRKVKKHRISAICRLIRNISKRFYNAARWFIKHSTRNRRNLFLTFFLGWLWVPATLLAAYGADVCSQIREYSWAWNQLTGLKQPYIGFFSFVPMDIYPTAHYLWPTQPTYLTDQHNIVLTVMYGAVAAVSRYFTHSNDAGIVLLAFTQFVFAAWCIAATAHRFLNKPWLTSNAQQATLSSRTSCTSRTSRTSCTSLSSRTPLFARFAVLLMFLLNPLVLCSTIALTKSPLFAFAFVWWFGINYELTCSYHADDTHAGIAKIHYGTFIELLISVCVMLIAAKYAWYILLIQCLLLLVFERKRWRVWVGGILLPTLVVHTALVLLISSGAVITGDPIESRGIQLQQIARIAKLDPHSIPHSAKRMIAPIFNLDQTAEAYKPYDADPVKSSGLQSKKVSYRWRYVTRDNIRNLNRAWWQMVTHSPLVAADAFIAKMYGYFDIFDRPYVGPEYYINTDNIRNSDWIRYWNSSWRTEFADVISSWSDVPVISWLIHGNTFVIATLLIGMAEIALRRWRTVLWHIPLALLVGVMILAPANNFERHMLPLVFVFCFVLLTFWRDSKQSASSESADASDTTNASDTSNASSASNAHAIQA